MRDRISLDGVWQARVDPHDTGIGDGWQQPGVPFDRQLQVPLPWQAADPTLRRYAGVAWYRRELAVPNHWAGHEVAVRFGAVDYRATIWLNSVEIGRHEGGYTPFELVIPPSALRSGANVLTLRVVDPADVRSIPHGKQGGRWYTPISGPWQSISLLCRPSSRVGAVRCYPDVRRGAVRVEVAYRGAPERSELAVDVLDAAGHMVGRTQAAVGPGDGQSVLDATVSSPRLWSPADPHRYTARVSLVADGATVDADEVRFGLRSFEAVRGELLLNGEPFYMRGALDQAYWPDTLYTAPSDAEIEREIRLAKEMGLNLLRKHIKPEDPRYLDAADRLGMLIWAEPANPLVFGPEANAALRRDLLAMVDRDFNHPSIVVWSLYNEDWGIPGLWSGAEQQGWLADLYRELKAYDPTRLVCDNSGWAHVLTDLNDYHEYYAVPERFPQFRSRLGFIRHDPDDNFAAGWSSRGEPYLVSEFGNWALPDPSQARARSGGQEPPWFSYDRAYARAEQLSPPPPENPLTERIKTVRGFEERFEALGLKTVFGSVERLVEHAQRRAFRAIKAEIEEMRSCPWLKGYVVTEFTDIEWEVNGWLDYWRQPKLFHHDLAAINADVALIAMPDAPTAWGDDAFAVRITVANTTGRPIRGTVRWRLDDGPSGELPTSVGPFETTELAAPLLLRAPVDRPRLARLDLTLVADGTELARTYAELAFAPRSHGRLEATASAHTLDRVFRQRLERQGLRLARSFSQDAPCAITTSLDASIVEYARLGGRVLFLAGEATEGADLIDLRTMPMQPAESWRMASGIAWADAAALAPAPVRADLGWEAMDIFPRQLFDGSSLGAADRQLAGWFEGWLANAGAFVVERQIGQGRVLATTFRFEQQYGLEPVATLLLHRLIALCTAPLV
jgi:hypothetical protein